MKTILKATLKEKILSTLFMLVIVFASIMFFIIGIYKTVEIVNFNKTSELVNAKIINIYMVESAGKIRPSYYYKVSFAANNGKIYTSEVGANIVKISFIAVPLKNINDDILIKYDTLNPSHIEMNNDFSSWFLPLIFTIIGLILIVVSFRSLLAIWKKN